MLHGIGTSFLDWPEDVAEPAEPVGSLGIHPNWYVQSRQCLPEQGIPKASK